MTGSNQLSIPNGQQCDIDAAKAFSDFGECRAYGNFVLVFPVADRTISGVASKIYFLV
jgi:hypothetical protein